MTSRHISFKIIKFVGMMKVTLIGAGNLATQLGKSLKKAGVIISQVYSRTEDSARTLGELLEAEWLTDIKALRYEADIYIFSVKDSVLCELISEACKGRGEKLFLHTAGSMPMSCLKERHCIMVCSILCKRSLKLRMWILNVSQCLLRAILLRRRMLLGVLLINLLSA